MKVAAIFPIGTSVGGAPDAIRQILGKESGLDVYLLPGRQGASNTPDPESFAQQVRDSISDRVINWVLCEAIEPFDLGRTYSQIRTELERIAQRGYERVYVGVTGGTNPMNVSLFQAAMAYLHTEVVPLYVQAHGAEWQSNFVASEIRDRIIAEDALKSARSGQIRVAAVLAQRLPTIGQWAFLRHSLEALSHWDDFDYPQASQRLEHQSSRCGEYKLRQLLAPVANTVLRIAGNARQMSDFTKQLRDVQNFESVVTTPDWMQSVAEKGMLMVGDVLANAMRRFDEQRYTDSVLRSYRAAECATQTRLLKLGIHPSKPNACRAAFERYAGLTDRPLAFDDGLKFLQAAERLDLTMIRDSVRALQQARNNTYLEHGYVRVQRDQAQRCLNWSVEICAALLGCSVRDSWREFEMRF